MYIYREQNSCRQTSHKIEVSGPGDITPFSMSEQVLTENNIWVAKHNDSGKYLIVFGVIPGVAYVCMRNGDNKDPDARSYTVEGFAIPSITFLSPPVLSVLLETEDSAEADFVACAMGAAAKMSLKSIDPRALPIDFAISMSSGDPPPPRMEHIRADESGNKQVVSETWL